MFILFFFIALVFAEETTPDAEITVFGDFEITAKRQKLHKKLKEMGYTQEVRKQGKTIYLPTIAWKPTIVVYDEGFIQLKRTKPRWRPNFEADRGSNVGYIPCFIPPLHSPVSMPGVGW